MIEHVRFAFAAIYSPETFPGGDGAAYGGAAIIPEDHPAVARLDKAYLDLAKAKWKDKAAAIVANCMKDRKKSAWQKCEYANDEGVVYDGFEGAFYLRVRNEDVPLILGPDAEEITKGKPGAPYGGCYVDLQVEPFLQDNTFGKALRCKMLGIMFVADGDAFAAGSKADKGAFKPKLSVAQDDEDADEFA
jgi:hypothetical protein